MPTTPKDLRIGTMVKCNSGDPASYVRQITPYGFESIEPFFWQTLGGADIPRLAGELREAIGDADVTISTLGMFGNPLEDRELDRSTLVGWKTLIDHAHLFGATTIAGFTGRVRGRPIEDSRATGRCGTTWRVAPPTRACASLSRTARWMAIGPPAIGTSPITRTPGS
jgi:sugar phosphate isomerase/epimerase